MVKAFVLFVISDGYTTIVMDTRLSWQQPGEGAGFESRRLLEAQRVGQELLSRDTDYVAGILCVIFRI